MPSKVLFVGKKKRRPWPFAHCATKLLKYENNYSPQCRWLVVDIYLAASRLGIYSLATSTSVNNYGLLVKPIPNPYIRYQFFLVQWSFQWGAVIVNGIKPYFKKVT